jgi:hypothetical protein
MTSFQSRLYGQDQAFQQIQDLYSDLPHIFVTGSSGCGKTTFLEDLIKMFQANAPFHVDSVLWLSSEKDRGIHTIRDKVNEFCKRAQLRPNSIRWIVIDDADTLPLISQQALRRPMETYSHLTRFLFASRHASHLIEPLRSRCLTLELEPFNPFDAYPLFLKEFGVDLQSQTPELYDFCIRNFITMYEMKSILKLYRANIEDGQTPQKALESLQCLLSSSTSLIGQLIIALAKRDGPKIIHLITKLYFDGYLLDDILLFIERQIAIFPNADPDARFNILQFTMLGWISIQQGKEHWLDTMDIVDQVLRASP